jgi:hypothetical protein
LYGELEHSFSAGMKFKVKKAFCNQRRHRFIWASIWDCPSANMLRLYHYIHMMTFLAILSPRDLSYKLWMFLASCVKTSHVAAAVGL